MSANKLPYVLTLFLILRFFHPLCFIQSVVKGLSLSKALWEPLEEIQRDTNRDLYMNGREAIEYGGSDAIMDRVWEFSKEKK
jgi:hypothetical protein